MFYKTFLLSGLKASKFLNQMIIFKAKTFEGHNIKILIELLQHIVKIACIEITAEGMFFKMMDSERKICVDIKLNRDNFNTYHITETKFLGINLPHFYQILRQIKIKDTITLSIDDQMPSKLNIVIDPQEQLRITRSSIYIQSIQNIDIQKPDGYGKSVIISASEYQRNIKDMANISPTITVSSRENSVMFSSHSQNIISRDIIFGEVDDDTDIQFTDDYNVEQFIRIVKISGLCKMIQVYCCKNLPLLFKCNIGQLGQMSIYIKSKQQLKNDVK